MPGARRRGGGAGDMIGRERRRRGGETSLSPFRVVARRSGNDGIALDGGVVEQWRRDM